MVVAKPCKPLATVPHVDLSEYLGRWYEIARYPARFERKCVVNAMANYPQRSDGKIEVLNTCRREDGSVKKTKGIAEIEDPNTNAKLKVTFLWPFSGDYCILDLAPGYSYAASRRAHPELFVDFEPHSTDGRDDLCLARPTFAIVRVRPSTAQMQSSG
jgi:lipocalin